MKNNKKMKKISFIAVALATVLLVGCQPDPEPTVNSVTLDKTKLTLAVGAEEMLKATVDPAGTAVAWASSDNAVAIVTGGGMVSAVAEGTAVITATAGELSGVARVKVIPQVIPATGLAFDKTEAFTISKDDVVTLNAIFTPENTTDKKLDDLDNFLLKSNDISFKNEDIRTLNVSEKYLKSKFSRYCFYITIHRFLHLLFAGTCPHRLPFLLYILRLSELLNPLPDWLAYRKYTQFFPVPLPLRSWKNTSFIFRISWSIMPA